MRVFTLKSGHQPSAVSTESEAYHNGYDTGLNWNHPWRPGGPWICGPALMPWQRREDVDPQWIAYCEATRENNKQWLRGFDDGRAAVERNPLLMHAAELGYN